MLFGVLSGKLQTFANLDKGIVRIVTPHKFTYLLYVRSGLNSHCFPMARDSHTPIDRGLYTHYKDCWLGWPYPLQGLWTLAYIYMLSSNNLHSSHMRSNPQGRVFCYLRWWDHLSYPYLAMDSEGFVEGSFKESNVGETWCNMQPWNKCSLETGDGKKMKDGRMIPSKSYHVLFAQWRIGERLPVYTLMY